MNILMISRTCGINFQITRIVWDERIVRVVRIILMNSLTVLKNISCLE